MFLKKYSSYFVSIPQHKGRRKKLAISYIIAHLPTPAASPNPHKERRVVKRNLGLIGSVERRNE
jgi:hypothetical protein